MELEKEIILPNRNGISTKFVKIEDNVYKLEQDGEWPCGITGSKENIKAVDPAGGPYIHVGYEINDYVVIEIKYDKGFKFKIEEVNNK